MDLQAIMKKLKEKQELQPSNSQIDPEKLAAARENFKKMLEKLRAKAQEAKEKTDAEK